MNIVIKSRASCRHRLVSELEWAPQLFNQKQTQLSRWREKVKNKIKRKLVLTIFRDWCITEFLKFCIDYRAVWSLCLSFTAAPRWILCGVSRLTHAHMRVLPADLHTHIVGPLLRVLLSILHSVPVNRSILNVQHLNSEITWTHIYEHSNVRILYLALSQQTQKIVQNTREIQIFPFIFFFCIYCVSFLCPHDSVLCLLIIQSKIFPIPFYLHFNGR